MARVTVEDCIDKVDNRFELVLLAGHRARQIANGAGITIERDNDKNPVVALREIASETLSPADLKEDLIHSLQRHVEVDEPENGKDDEEIIAIPQLNDFRQDSPGTTAVFSSFAAEGNEEEAEPKAIFENMSEEELLAGIENLVPPEKNDDY